MVSKLGSFFLGLKCEAQKHEQKQWVGNDKRRGEEPRVLQNHSFIESPKPPFPLGLWSERGRGKSKQQQLVAVPIIY